MYGIYNIKTGDFVTNGACFDAIYWSFENKDNAQIFLNMNFESKEDTKGLFKVSILPESDSPNWSVDSPQKDGWHLCK